MNHENELQNMIHSCEEMSNKLDFAITLMVANGIHYSEYGTTSKGSDDLWHF